MASLPHTVTLAHKTLNSDCSNFTIILFQNPHFGSNSHIPLQTKWHVSKILKKQQQHSSSLNSSFLLTICFIITERSQHLRCSINPPCLTHLASFIFVIIPFSMTLAKQFSWITWQSYTSALCVFLHSYILILDRRSIVLMAQSISAMKFLLQYL